MRLLILTDFVECFDCTGINGQYRISQWNYYDYQGWHSRLKEIVGKSNHNIFEIINVMRKEQATMKMKLNQFEAGAMHAAIPKREICAERCKINHTV